MNDTKWVSMWGNAMSIAEHHPEGYAKDLTLRYPVYAPFSGSALRFTLDNYCGPLTAAIPSHWQRVHPPRAMHSPFRYLPVRRSASACILTATLPCSPPC